MMTREQLIDKIVDLFIDNSDDEGSWEGADICEAVMSFLVHEGSNRILQCGYCSTWYPHNIYDCCPYYDSHPCGGDCGETNENCTCDNCDDCGCYECECQRCTKCSYKQGECNCPIEEAVFR